MVEEPESLVELHRIREQIYEAEKQLSHRERVERLRQQTENYLKRTGLKLQRISPSSQTAAR